MSTPEKSASPLSRILSMSGVDRYSAKTVAWAAPMTLGAYAKMRGVAVPPKEDEASEGFLVEEVGAAPNFPGFGGKIIWMVAGIFRDKYEVTRVLKSTDYVDRMLGELCEATDRIQKLEAFLKTEKFGALPQAEQQDLAGQLKGMHDHVWFLSRRVRRLGDSNVNA